MPVEQVSGTYPHFPQALLQGPGGRELHFQPLPPDGKVKPPESKGAAPKFHEQVWPRVSSLGVQLLSPLLGTKPLTSLALYP